MFYDSVMYTRDEWVYHTPVRYLSSVIALINIYYVKGVPSCWRGDSTASNHLASAQ